MNMTKSNNELNRKRKKRINIKNIEEFKDALCIEGYKINTDNEKGLKEDITDIFKVHSSVSEEIIRCITNSNITYRANNIMDFVDYMEKIIIFENEHNKLCKKIEGIKKITIDRVEYEREADCQDNVEDIIELIEDVKDIVSEKISKSEEKRLKVLEDELDKNYLYSKDIELLKMMISTNNKNIREEYNYKNKVKTIFMEVPEKIGYGYIKPNKGTIEYHQHIISNIPRMQRLIKNMNKYIKVNKEDNSIIKVDQSEALQDSINIAVATYDNKEFKAISGKNNINNYCKIISLNRASFKSIKVNKLGKLGVGYNRMNDSEKKILEEIDRQIYNKMLRDKGKLILYSKWEPCPSCYYVISQFCSKYPDIDVRVKYSKKYGEVSN